MILCDVDGENVAALKARTAEYGPRVTIVPGDCNEVTQGAIESIAAPIRNTKNGLLYHLVHASKKGKGDAIWSSVTKIDSSGQTSLWSPDQRRRPSGASCAASTGAVWSAHFDVLGNHIHLVVEAVDEVQFGRAMKGLEAPWRGL